LEKAMSRHPIGERAMTPAERQRRFMAKLRSRAAGRPSPAPPSPPPLLIELAAEAVATVAAERRTFEAWFEAHSAPTAHSKFVLDGDGDYKLDVVQAAWEAWRARGG
jgi:hypothetical protein